MGGSFSTSEHVSMGTNQSFRIETKRFDIALEEGKPIQVKIKESGKHHICSVSLDKDGVRWLAKCIEENVMRESEPSLIRTLRENTHGFVI